MPSYKEYFKGKKITVMRIGLLGRGVGDTALLAKCGANILVVDNASQKEMQLSVDRLKKYKNIRFKFGSYDLKDFRNCDMVLKGAGTPIDSPEIAEAKRNNVPVEMSASLFVKLAGLKTIGVTGTRGKSTVTQMIAHILKMARKKFVLGGNIKGVSNLALLPQAKNAELALFELDSWQLQGFADNNISPDISVFTTFLPDHLNYYDGNMEKYFEDKAAIFKNQKESRVLVVGKQVLPFLKEWQAQKNNGKIKSQIIVAPTKLPKGFSLAIPGAHNLYNAAMALEVARTLGVKDSVSKRALKSFNGVEGRLELIRKIKGISFYNDTTSTVPDATIAALKALSDSRFKNQESRIILIMGGSDKGLDMSPLLKILERHCKTVILLSGTGTNLVSPIISKLKIFKGEFDNLEEVVLAAREEARRGDIVLLSPAFASFGMFKNEFDRGEQFNKIVKKLR